MHGETHQSSDPVLSVVIITENEAANVEDCIESVIEAARRAVSSFEVILVDSASTDRTVELARRYPVSVVRIPDEHVVSCGAGRYVGDNAASGEFVLHVDGDMELTDNWLAEAVSYLRAHDDVAGVEGCLNTVEEDGVVRPDTIGGVMLFDAAVLAAVGGFDPHLRGYEDIDVSYRLSGAGYHLVRLPLVSATHEWDETLFEPIRRWRAGYYEAAGQAMRKAWPDLDQLRKLVAVQRYKFALLAWLTVGTAALLSPLLLLGWLALSVLGAGVVVRERGPVGAVRFFVMKLFGIAGVTVGLGNPPAPPETYPLEAAERVTQGRILDGEATVVDQ